MKNKTIDSNIPVVVLQYKGKTTIEVAAGGGVSSMSIEDELYVEHNGMSVLIVEGADINAAINHAVKNVFKIVGPLCFEDRT